MRRDGRILLVSVLLIAGAAAFSVSNYVQKDQSSQNVCYDTDWKVRGYSVDGGRSCLCHLGWYQTFPRPDFDCTLHDGCASSAGLSSTPYSMEVKANSNMDVTVSVSFPFVADRMVQSISLMNSTECSFPDSRYWRRSVSDCVDTFVLTVPRAAIASSCPIPESEDGTHLSGTVHIVMADAEHARDRSVSYTASEEILSFTTHNPASLLTTGGKVKRDATNPITVLASITRFEPNEMFASATITFVTNVQDPYRLIQGGSITLPVELEGDVEYTLSETTVFEETCLTDCHQTFELLIESINEEEYLTSYDGDYVIPFTTTCNVESLEPCDDLTLPSVTLRVAYGGLTIDPQELTYGHGEFILNSYVFSRVEAMPVEFVLHGPYIDYELTSLSVVDYSSEPPTFHPVIGEGAPEINWSRDDMTTSGVIPLGYYFSSIADPVEVVLSGTVLATLNEGWEIYERRRSGSGKRTMEVKSKPVSIQPKKR